MSGIPVVTTIADALNPAWLSRVLSPMTGGAPITSVETVETIQTMATKVRFTVGYDGAPGGKVALCMKGLLDSDPEARRAGAITVLEADFYDRIAPHLSLRLPTKVASVIDRDAPLAIVIMRDLIAEGASFCSALEPFSADDIAGSLDQLAQLHVRTDLLDAIPGIRRRIADPARLAYTPEPLLQELLDGARGATLPTKTRDAKRMIAAMRALAAEDETLPQALVHGDSHAGNIFKTSEGLGLIDWQVVQRGGWALDVAYHITAALPVDMAEREEQTLLLHYLEAARRYGGPVIDSEAAWRQYRMAAVYGYYLWGITRRVDPQITNTFVARLGAAVTRHESFRLLSV